MGSPDSLNCPPVVGGTQRREVVGGKQRERKSIESPLRGMEEEAAPDQVKRLRNLASQDLWCQPSM